MALDANRLVTISRAKRAALLGAHQSGQIFDGEAHSTLAVASPIGCSPALAELVSILARNWDFKPLVGAYLGSRATAGS